VLHSMKDALMKYETIDANQIDDLMKRIEVRPPKDWDNDDDDKTVKASKEDSSDKKSDDPAPSNESAQ
jgi:cell division protease FtsH